MDQQSWGQPKAPIRITRQEAMGGHVDDLLKRQMSLQGETGITRDHGRKWYYQNWFVFMVAGALAAFAAWAIIEPILNDYFYFQGPIESVDEPAVLPSGFDPMFEGLSSIRVQGADIVLSRETKEMRSDGTKPLLDRDALRPGQEVGVYVHSQQVLTEFAVENMHIGVYVLTSPTPNLNQKAKLSFEEQQKRDAAGGLLLFPLVAGFIGLAIGCVDGIVCRAFRRALLGGVLGALIGFLGGFVSNAIANLVYAPLSALAMKQAEPQLFTTVRSLNALGFILQMTGRGIAWVVAGMAMGLAQGITLRSKRLLIYGFLGSIIGGLVGGLLFDPIDLLIGEGRASAHLSRMISLTVIGACVGGMIGLVELLARDAWLRMTAGPLAGKEFLIFKDIMKIGSSPRSEIYLFNDAEVAQHHATIRAISDQCEIESINADNPTLLNGRPIKRARLRHGDEIRLGRTAFVFQKQKG